MPQQDTTHLDAEAPLCPSLVPILDASIVPALLVHAESGRIVRYNAVASRMFGWPGLLGSSAGPTEEMQFSDYVSFYEKDSRSEQRDGAEAVDDDEDDDEPLLWQDVLVGIEDGRLQLEGVGVMSSGDGFAVTISMAKVGACCGSCPNSSGDYLFVYAQQQGAVRRGSGRRLLEEAKTDIKRKERLTASIIAASFDPLVAIDESGIIQMVNRATIDQFGWSEEELVGANVSMLVGGGHSKSHDEYIARHLRTGEKRVMGKKRELRARRRDGSEIPIELYLTEVFTEEGEGRLFTGFLRNLTDIKRQQRLTAGVIDASFDPVFAINSKGIITMANKAAIDQLGYAKERLIGSNISLVVGGGHADRHDDYIKHFLKTGEKRAMGFRRELSARRADGSEMVIELGLAELEVEKGEERQFVGFLRDLSRLKQREKLTTGILESSFDAMFAIDEKGIIQMVNDSAVSSFGWSRSELVGSNVSMIVGGGHSERHDEYLARYLRTGEKRVMGLRRELPARRKDGSEFWIELGLTEVRTENGSGGNGRLYCGFLKDLTGLKAREAEILRGESRMRGIVEASFAAMFAVNEEGKILMVNEAAVRQFGYTRDEFLGRNINMICPPEHKDRHDSYLLRYLETGKSRLLGKKRELTAVRKDGTLFPILLGVTEVEYTGKTKMFAAFIEDLTTQKKLHEVEVESAKAEALLLNMLPEDVALRLKRDPGHIADHHQNVAILFADIVGFTKMSSSMTPVEVVSMLNDLFSMFDVLVEKYDLNKVKTIGDCYMVTSHPGVESDVDECIHMCSFGLEMIDALHDYNKRNSSKTMNLRVGVNVGPVVAGVVGTKRFLYDLWGDTVNLASRMESTGIPGKIQCTKAVKDQAGKLFSFESRGLLHVKGKGEMEAFILTGRIDGSAPLPPVRPNLRQATQGKGGVNIFESLRKLKSTREMLGEKIGDMETHLEEEGT